MTPLTSDGVYSTLKRFLPAQNDDFKCNYVEELQELVDFQITTEEQLTDLLQRRAGEIMEIDRSSMDDHHLRVYSSDYEEEFVGKRFRDGFWFSYPALLRIALELEFGKAYKDYADKRDTIVSRHHMKPFLLSLLIGIVFEVLQIIVFFLFMPSDHNEQLPSTIVLCLHAPAIFFFKSILQLHWLAHPAAIVAMTLCWSLAAYFLLFRRSRKGDLHA